MTEQLEQDQKSRISFNLDQDTVYLNPAYEGDNERVSSTSNLAGQEGRTQQRRGSIFPNQVFYSWKNISATAKVTSEKPIVSFFKRSKVIPEPKLILNNVSGIAIPGELLSIIGASGAGKTTLLNILTYRKTNSIKITGERLVNGVPIDADTLTLLSAYIQQDDIFIGTLTAREHLIFHALLKMDKKVSYKERLTRVNEVIQEMGLSSCADTVIGIPGRTKGLSGGEKKRLSVASEILTDPKILLCDEITTGLDSFMAQSVMKTLKGLANKGKTIICTIHQPASEIFALFDKLFLMSEGRIAYYGEAQQAANYFSSFGYSCPENYNPADYFIQTLAIKIGKEEESLQRAKEICDKYDSSDLMRRLMINIEEEGQDKQMLEGLKREGELRKVSPYKASWFAQFRACLWRSGIVVLKNPFVLKIQLLQTIFFSLIIGIIYLGQELDQDGVQNINGCIFIIIANLTFSSVFPVTNVFWQELPVFIKEHFDGMYRTDVYYLGKTFAELPVYLILPALFMSIIYYIVGFNPAADRFFIAMMIAILISNVGSSFGYMASTLSASFEMTMGLAPIFIMPFLLFGGTFMNKDSVPVYFVWLQYVSWFLHGNEALSVNQWKGVSNISCNHFNPSCLTTGEQVLESRSFKEDNFGIALTVLGVLIVATRFLSFLGLLLKTRRAN